MIVLDTHIWVWLETKPALVPAAILSVLRHEPDWGISAVSLWEIAMLQKKGRIELPLPTLEWFDNLLARPRVRLLSLSPKIAAMSVDLPIHSDPFDRIIAATALLHQTRLATVDKVLVECPAIKTIEF